MAGPQATATGTLGSTPLANLLIYALDRRLTGTLVLEDPHARKSAIVFRSGTPRKVKTGEPVARLPDVLVDLHLIDRDVARDVETAARAEKVLFGRALVARGLIDEESLGDGLEEQMLRRVDWLCTLDPKTVYGYYDGVDLLQSYGAPDGVAAEPLAVTWRALRVLASPAVVDSTLAKLGARELRLHPQSRAAKFRFDPREQAAVDVIRAKPQSLASLIATGLLPEPHLKKVVYGLVVTRHLDLGGGAAPVGASEQSLMPPARSQVPVRRSSNPAEKSVAKNGADSGGSGSNEPPRRATPSQGAGSPAPGGSIVTPTPDPRRTAPKVDAASSPKNPSSGPAGRDEAFVAEIRETSEGMGGKDYYQVLGVERDAAGPVIQAAFFRLAKRWHPDRLGPDYADVKDVAARVFARMTEAHQVLSNEEQRCEYDRALQSSDPSAEQEEIQRVLRAATAFQKAEVLIKRGNLAEAQKQAEIAVQSDPEQAEYVALYADILSQNPERQRSNNYAEVVKMVNEARKRQPDNMKVRLYRARVLNRSGDNEGAYREFRNIVEQDAHNVEAAREVRLYEMRRGRRTTDARKPLPPRESEPRRSPPRAGDKDGKPEPKGALNQDIGEIFGKLFKK